MAKPGYRGNRTLFRHLSPSPRRCLRDVSPAMPSLFAHSRTHPHCPPPVHTHALPSLPARCPPAFATPVYPKSPIQSPTGRRVPGAYLGRPAHTSAFGAHIDARHPPALGQREAGKLTVTRQTYTSSQYHHVAVSVAAVAREVALGALCQDCAPQADSGSIQLKCHSRSNDRRVHLSP